MALNKNMKISTKIVLGFSLMILISVVIGLGGYRSLKRIKTNLDGILTVNIPSLDYLIEADRDNYQLLVAERSMIFSNTESPVFKELVVEYETNLKQADERWEKFKALDISDNNQLKDKMNQYEKTRALWLPLSRQIFEARKEDSRDGRRLALDLSLGQARDAYENMRSRLDELSVIIREQSTKAHESAQKDYLQSNVIMIVLILVGFLSGAVLTVVIRQNITGPARDLVEGLKDIAQGEGDLTRRLIEKSDDELGQVAMWFNTFMNKLQDLIKNIARTSGDLGHSASQLSVLSGRMAVNSENMNEKAAMVATSARAINDNFTSMAEAMKQAATNTGRVESATDTLSASVSGIAKNTENARCVTNDAASQSLQASMKMKLLGEAAKSIDKVTEVINEISEQTNLLALNATIEAARAGEAGKGFAVVANEIKELARQTAIATDEIKKKINEIQTSTTETVHEIEHIANVISQTNETVTSITQALDEQSSVTRGISENASHMATGIQEINGNVSRSSKTTEQIAQEIAEISRAIGDMSNDSAQVADNSRGLDSLSKTLNTLVNQFKV